MDKVILYILITMLLELVGVKIYKAIKNINSPSKTFYANFDCSNDKDVSSLVIYTRSHGVTGIVNTFHGEKAKRIHESLMYDNPIITMNDVWDWVHEYDMLKKITMNDVRSLCGLNKIEEGL